jgi:hypothetical protein
MRPGRIVLGGEHVHVVAGGQLPAKMKCVDLGARGVPGQKVVNRVEDAQRHA